MIESRRRAGSSLKARLALIGVLILLPFLVSACAMAPWDIPHRMFGLGFFGFPLAIIGIAVYFTPTIIAALRHARSLVGIVLVNVLLGWTYVGWVVAFIWSLVGARNKS